MDAMQKQFAVFMKSQLGKDKSKKKKKKKTGKKDKDKVKKDKKSDKDKDIPKPPQSALRGGKRSASEPQSHSAAKRLRFEAPLPTLDESNNASLDLDSSCPSFDASSNVKQADTKKVKPSFGGVASVATPKTPRTPKTPKTPKPNKKSEVKDTPKSSLLSDVPDTPAADLTPSTRLSRKRKLDSPAKNLRSPK